MKQAKSLQAMSKSELKEELWKIEDLLFARRPPLPQSHWRDWLNARRNLILGKLSEIKKTDKRQPS